MTIRNLRAAMRPLLLGGVLWCALPLGEAAAHRLNVFAWVEGDTVHTESKFSGGRRARNAEVAVFDEADVRLLEGKTDEKGAFAFRVPGRSGLRIVVDAGAGHRGRWDLPRAEIAAALDAAGEKPPEPGAPEGTETAGNGAPAPARPAPGHPRAPEHLSAEALRAVVETALQQQLKPLVLRLNRLEAASGRPRWSDVMGGIGYILGLVGLAAWLKHRRKA